MSSAGSRKKHGTRRVTAAAECHGEIETARKREQESARERVAGAERVRAIDRLHLRPDDLAAARGDCAGAAELDADDAVELCQRECGVGGVEPGKCVRFVGVREQDAGPRGRVEKAIGAESRDEPRRGGVDGEPLCSRALERRPRSASGPACRSA